MGETHKKTGYPSIDKPWLKYYKETAEEEANNTPKDKTVWDIIEESLYKHIEVPAIEYFGRVITRKQFIENVYYWARVFKRLGVNEDEIVAYYGPFVPEIGYIALALNIIGACPYFLKLAISPEALAEETKESKIAIVFDQMWDKVKCEFSKERFETVIVIKATDSMPFPKKQLLSVLYSMTNKPKIPKGKKYKSVLQMKKLVEGSDSDFKAPFVPNRNAFITSSSGTTVGGIVKGVVATNETVLAQLFMERATGCQYFPGERCLNHFPPTAATSLNILFLLPLFNGMTVVLDPRVSEKDFYNQIMKYHANVLCNTGSAWEAFFERLEANTKSIDSLDFSYVRSWVVGGEGTDSDKFIKWQQIMGKAKSDRGLASAYGSSEVFASACSEEVNARYDFSKPIMSVGIPFAGITVGVFDKDGQELGYDQRGELWIKSNSMMKCYYNKPQLTAQTKIDGWIHTGDLAEIDANGFVYIWGRVKDAIQLPSGRQTYLFDIAYKLKEKDYIYDAIILEKKIDNEQISVVAHIVWDKSAKENKIDYLKDMTETVMQYEPEVNLCAYAYHERMLPYSPTTLKKDKNRMSEQNEGYVQVFDDKIINICFQEIGNGTYRIKTVR